MERCKVKGIGNKLARVARINQIILHRQKRPDERRGPLPMDLTPWVLAFRNIAGALLDKKLSFNSSYMLRLIE